MSVLATIMLCSYSTLGTTPFSPSLFMMYPTLANAQPDLQTTTSRDLEIDLGNGIKTNAQLTLPILGSGPYPGVLLITGSGAEDMNSSAIFIRLNETTGEKEYPPVPFFQIAQYLSDRGYAVLRYDKRGVGTNHTLDTNVWGNVTLDNLREDANRALQALMQQPEVDNTKITVLGHSEGTILAPRVAIDNPDIVKNIVLMGAAAQNISEILHYQTVTLPLKYAKEVLDKNGNGSLSLQEASRDLVFDRLIEGNLTLLLTENLPNGTEFIKPEYDRNDDAQIDIENELKPALEPLSHRVFGPLPSDTGGRCTNLEGCSAYGESFLAFEQNIEMISKVPSTIGILILNGENDTQTPVEQALLLQQRLTEVRHPDHTLITYPNLGHEFHPSSQWFSEHGPIPEYVLQDIFRWLSDPVRDFKKLTILSFSS